MDWVAKLTGNAPLPVAAEHVGLDKQRDGENDYEHGQHSDGDE